jgi:flagellar hook-length control protein FliK
MIQKIPLKLLERLSDARARAPASGPSGMDDTDPSAPSGAAEPASGDSDPGTTRAVGAEARVRRSFAAAMSQAEKPDPGAGVVAVQVTVRPESPRVEASAPGPGENAAEGVAGPAERAPVETGASVAAFDLPTFLRVLPAAGPEVAVAAAREPAMAEALRLLPRTAPEGEALAASPAAESPVQLPPFLLAGKPDGIGGGAPQRPVEPSQVRAAVTPSAIVPERAASAPGSPEAGRALQMIDPPASRPGRRPPAVAMQEVRAAPALAQGREDVRAVQTRPLPDPSVVGVSLRPVAAERLERSLRSTEFRTMAALPAVALTTEVGAVTMGPAPASGSDMGPPSDLPQLREPVGTDAWQDELSAQLSVMAEQGERSEAVMKLAPEGLGELEIRLEMSGAEASLQFGAASAEARQALELAQARLRDMLSTQGIRVSEFSIFSSLGGNPQNSSSKGGQTRAGPSGLIPFSEERVSELRVVARSGRSAGVVDLYA